MKQAITFNLDGNDVEAAQGESIWQSAKRHSIDIPHLCHLPEPGYHADGNCRACVVEIEGERVLAPSCSRMPAPGMVVKTGVAVSSARSRKASVAPANSTPAPAQINGFLAAINALAAALIALASGAWRVSLGD